MNIPKTDKKRVVVIGGGFAGISLAKKLKDLDVQLVLLDKQNYHTFQPLLYQVSTSGLEPDSIAHRVELGYAYAADGHEERAREQWQTALGFDSRFLYDPAAKIRAREALGQRPL